MGATTDIVTAAITTHTITVVITIDISMVASIIGTAFGLPVPVGIIAIGKRRHQGSDL